MTLPDQPKISIVTCFLNVEKYIEETIQSVLAQDYTNWELLLVDDGSYDESTAIAKSYATALPGKVLYFDHEGHRNAGASYSRNVAIAKATGMYITFLDADDVWLPNYLSQQLQTAYEQNVELVFEATEYWYNWQQHGKRNTIIPIGTKADQTYTPPQLMYNLYPLGDGAAPCICGMLLKRSLLLKHGSFDESFPGMYDDQALLAKLYLHEKIYISSAANNRYRQRQESLVHTSHKAGNYHRERRYFLEWFESYLQQQNIHDPRISKLLKEALLPYRSPLQHYMVQVFPTKIKEKAKRLLNASLKRGKRQIQL